MKTLIMILSLGLIVMQVSVWASENAPEPEPQKPTEEPRPAQATNANAAPSASPTLGEVKPALQNENSDLAKERACEAEASECPALNLTAALDAFDRFAKSVPSFLGLNPYFDAAKQALLASPQMSERAANEDSKQGLDGNFYYYEGWSIQGGELKPNAGVAKTPLELDL